MNDDDDNVSDDGFVVVKSSDYVDGCVVVPMLTAQLPRELAKRTVFVVCQFQSQTIVSKHQLVSPSGKVRVELFASVRVVDFARDMRLSLLLYVRPRFFGSVRLHGLCSIDVVEDVILTRNELTPGVELVLPLRARHEQQQQQQQRTTLGTLAVNFMFFTDAERAAMDAFVESSRQLNRSSRELPPSLPVATQQNPSEQAAAPAPPQVFLVDSTPIVCQLCRAETPRAHALELDCLHAFCVACLRNHVTLALAVPGSIEIPCPCSRKGHDDVDHTGDDDDDDDNNNNNNNSKHRKAVISAAEASAVARCVVGQWALRAVLPVDEFDRYLDASLRLATAQDARFFQCPAAECGAVMERLEPVPIAGDGDAASRHALLLSSSEERLAAARHKELQRFRCRACRVVFCAECKAVPYHVGFTCAAFERFKKTRRCRFCDEPISAPPDASAPPALQLVCDEDDCRAKAERSCAVTLECGHACCGVAGESEHLKCLHCEVGDKEPLADEFCGICYVDALSAAPSIELECGHVFHVECVEQRLRNRWNGPVIAFQFLDCPLCAKPINHASVAELLKVARKFKDTVEAKANQRLVFEELLNDKQLTDKSSRFFRKPVEFAMARYAYHECFRCHEAYFAGQKSCQEARADAHDPSELVCGACSGAALGGAATSCKRHKEQFIAFKCQFCCSAASWFCWGTTHFCDACHTKQRSGEWLNRKPLDYFAACDGGANGCPLHIHHPPNGTKVSICLGCTVCKQESEF
jgi:hypothetical protein